MRTDTVKVYFVDFTAPNAYTGTVVLWVGTTVQFVLEDLLVASEDLPFDFSIEPVLVSTVPYGCGLEMTSGGGVNANSITLGLEIDEDLFVLNYGEFTISVGIKDPSTGYADTALVEFAFDVILTEFSPTEDVTFE